MICVRNAAITFSFRVCQSQSIVFYTYPYAPPPLLPQCAKKRQVLFQDFIIIIIFFFIENIPVIQYATDDRSCTPVRNAKHPQTCSTHDPHDEYALKIQQRRCPKHTLTIYYTYVRTSISFRRGKIRFQCTKNSTTVRKLFPKVTRTYEKCYLTDGKM